MDHVRRPRKLTCAVPASYLTKIAVVQISYMSALAPFAPSLNEGVGADLLDILFKNSDRPIAMDSDVRLLTPTDRHSG